MWFNIKMKWWLNKNIFLSHRVTHGLVIRSAYSSASCDSKEHDLYVRLEAIHNDYMWVKSLVSPKALFACNTNGFVVWSKTHTFTHTINSLASSEIKGRNTMFRLLFLFSQCVNIIVSPAPLTVCRQHLDPTRPNSTANNSHLSAHQNGNTLHVK